MSLPATPNYLTGHVVAVSLGATLAYATQGNVDRSVNTIKVTNARSNGYAQRKAGIKDAAGTIECVVNGDDLFDLEPGVEITIHWVPTGGTPRTLNALVAKVHDKFVVEGEYTWSFDWECSGQYYTS